MLTDTFGYVTAMTIKNAIILLAGIFLGMYFALNACSRFATQVECDKRVKKAALVRINGKFYAYPVTINDYYETLCTWIVATITRRKIVTFQTQRLGMFLRIVFISVAIGSVIFGFRYMLNIHMYVE